MKENRIIAYISYVNERESHMVREESGCILNNVTDHTSLDSHYKYKGSISLAKSVLSTLLVREYYNDAPIPSKKFAHLQTKMFKMSLSWVKFCFTASLSSLTNML